jgi:predicted anti-sigma-YlaC factor YlaD
MPKGLHCQKLLEELSDFIDGVAGQELCDRIEAHLAYCPDCGILVSTLQKTVTLYQQRGGVEPLPHDVRHRLCKVLDLGEYLNG